MTSVPYPTFINQAPVDADSGRSALSAVGKCRIFPEKYGSDDFQAIIAKNKEQALVNVDVEDKEQKDVNKKLRKKYMKEGVAMAKKFLADTLLLDVSIVDVEIFVEAKDLLETDGCVAACLLDAGCHAIVTDGSDIAALDAAKVPRERLVAHFYCPFALVLSSSETSEESMVTIASAAALASVISVEVSGSDSVSVDAVTQILHFQMDKQKDLNFQIVVQLNPIDCACQDDSELASTIGTMLKTCKDGHGTLTLVDPSASQLGLSYAACMKTDRADGLYTTVVCTRSGEALGLVYSSKESIVAALECGRGVYYSRSRNGLWRKGDTSGHYQTLHRLDVDCDGDALRFTVTQKGENVAAFCHLNTLTCWGEPRGIRHLEATLKDRLKSAPEGSYTKRLFDDEELLRDKLVEEAQELSEATGKDHVAEELADVLYFAMARAVKAGVSIDDAVEELDRRTRKVTRRKGDSKAFRIAAGDAILGKPPC
eukprot:CAMPEP_0119004026 /NCGR_PEP_ID=MMETSP1176-20130426/903_1 /TAXON_ID=265551 /ORGANISM="Synedropsis recta cf, Strain CCMP1620" /LENGTH=483 /DNA_ID=CAMNT_0006955687 /DNA_START=44 /DNA_END=1495 /DNA_ORIENTATION=+